MPRKLPRLVFTVLLALLLVTFQFKMAFLLVRAANDGSLDAAFDTDGIVTTDFGNADFGYGVTIQSDNKMIVAGYAYTGQSYDFALARYNSDGSLDPAFGTNGKVTTDFLGETEHANVLVLQSDGKIISAGLVYVGTTIDFALARYNSDGSLDPAFGTNGKVTTDFGQFDHGQAIAIQQDGKIVVAGLSYITGQYDFVVARYHSNGSLDLSFDGDGKVLTDFGGEDYGYSLGLQSDGKLVVAGYSNAGGTTDVALARYNSDGSLDPAFGTNGKVLTDFGGEDYGYSLGLQSDGKLVVAGLIDLGDNADFMLARYNGDGSLDLSFDGDGKVLTDFGGDDRSYSLGLQGDGKLIVAGQVNLTGTYDFGLARYYSNGSLDPAFGTNGKVITDLGANDLANMLAIQSDGNLVLVGYSNIGGSADFALARYYANGNGPDLTPISTFTPPASPTPTATPTMTPSATPDNPATPTATATASASGTVTPSTPDVTPTATPSGTPGDSSTPPTATNTPPVLGTGTPATPTATPPLPSGAVSVTAQPDQPTTLVYQADTGCRCSLEFPAGAVSEPTTFVYQPLTTPMNSLGAYQLAGLAFTLTAYRNGELLEPFVFNPSITLTIGCASDTMNGLDEAQAQLLAYDPTSGQWSTVGIILIERNLSEHSLRVTIAQLGEFALVAPARARNIYLPVIWGKQS